LMDEVGIQINEAENFYVKLNDWCCFFLFNRSTNSIYRTTKSFCTWSVSVGYLCFFKYMP
jgi:hypothetical protein